MKPALTTCIFFIIANKDLCVFPLLVSEFQVLSVAYAEDEGRLMVTGDDLLVRVTSIFFFLCCSSVVSGGKGDNLLYFVSTYLLVSCLCCQLKVIDPTGDEIHFKGVLISLLYDLKWQETNFRTKRII